MGLQQVRVIIPYPSYQLRPALDSYVNSDKINSINIELIRADLHVPLWE
jgi:hypothetical protein